MMKENNAFTSIIISYDFGLSIRSDGGFETYVFRNNKISSNKSLH